MKTLVGTIIIKLPLLFILFIMVRSTAISQTDYYIKDGNRFEEVRLDDRGSTNNANFITGKVGAEDIRFEPGEIEEYGFRDGTRYISENTTINDTTERFFFELLYDNKSVLYYLKQPEYPRFFIKNDKGDLVAITKESGDGTDYHSQLLEITSDCEKLETAGKRVPYRGEAMTKFFKLYDECSGRPFPHFSWGVIAGYRTHEAFKPRLIERHPLSYFDFDSKNSGMIGVFVDNPISVSDLSIHSEVYFTWEKFFKYYKSEELDLDLQTSAIILNIPLMVRYTFPFNHFTAYLNGGATYSRNFGANSTLISVNKTWNSNYYSVKKEDVTGQIYDKNYLTFTYGAGVKFYFSYKNYIFLEFRRNDFRGITSRSTLNISEFHVLSGISL